MSVVLSEDEALAFHEKARSLKPIQECRPSTYWVGVLQHDKSHETFEAETDFLWVKCHKKITVETVHQAYLSRFPGVTMTLMHSSGAVSGTTTMANLNDYRDKIVILRAMQGPSIRQPLQPTKKQVVVKPPPQEQQENESVDGVKPQWSQENAVTKFECLAPRPPTNHDSTLPARDDLPLISKTDPKQQSPEPTEGRIAGEISGAYISPYPPVKVENHEDFPGPTQILPFEDQRSQEGQTESVSIKTDDMTVSRNAQLQVLCSSASPETLERAAEAGLGLLNSIRDYFSDQMRQTQDSAQWLQQIEAVEMQASKTRTIVGVVGNTGAGKSSVINAMLDEERLVPTNCMRACTAVVTELSYNESDDPQKKYLAKIEFIAAADWQKELRILFQELIDADGKISRECNNSESEAGIAYAKIRAVYPKKTKDELAKSSVESLMEELMVKDLFGTTREIHCSEPKRFHTQLQRYVDSKEKSTGQGKKDKKERREMEFWPLIRVVKIYVKAPALSTGAVIVDLPGVHDQNAARAAVAESYMKQCTGLWIVAPITRAVDDKAAKDLLGESFKRQLKMDGGYNSVTFICSKTDDISVEEAIDSLGLEEELSEFNEQIRTYREDKKRLTAKLAELRESKAVYGQAMEEVDEQLEVWEALKEAMEDGKTVYDPGSGSKKDKKRKRESSKEKPPKRLRQENSSGGDSDSDFQDDELEADTVASKGSRDDEPTDESPAKPLTAEEVNSKLNDLRDTKKSARRQRVELGRNINAVESDRREVELEVDKIQGQMSTLCIAGRNAYSKGAIQRDFAAGIKELDQELALEEDEENFNPDVELRDYDQVARSLPVFCVSSRGYQKLRGRMENDQSISAFTRIEETEIPLLQAHCKKLTEAGRAANCRRFLNSLSQLCNSLCLWASTDGTGATLTNDQKEGEVKALLARLEKLEDKLDMAVRKCMNALKEELGDQIYEKYEPAISSATASAPTTCSKWGAPINRENRAEGGFFWATYKAICRRGGCFTNAQGTHDFNMQLVEPMIKILATGWERVFARSIPNVLSQYARSAGHALQSFHMDVETRARANGAGIAGLAMLTQQLQIYEAIFKDVVAISMEAINARQREINREFTPVIAAAMQTAYEAVENEGGTGCFARMKSYMSGHIDCAKNSMFKKSTEEIRKRLSKMLSSVEETISNRTEEVFALIRRDYMAVLGGDPLTQGEFMPKQERMLRNGAKDIIKGYDHVWDELANNEAHADGKDAEAMELDDSYPVETDGQRPVNGEDAHAEHGDDSMSEDDVHPDASEN